MRISATARGIRPRLVGWVVALVAIWTVALAVVADPPPLRVVGTQPAHGAVLDAPPRDVSVSLTGVRQPEEFHLSAARSDQGGLVTTSPGDLRGQWLVAPVSIKDSGDYVTAYHVKLADGRQVSGFSRFTVARSSSADGPPVDTAPGNATQPADLAGHDHAREDPLSRALLGLDLALVLIVAVIMARRPRLRRAGDRT